MSDPKRSLNISSGSSTTTPDALPIPEEDILSGDRWTDFKRASQRLSLSDLSNIEQIPCIRTSLLYGIGSGVGMGAIRFFGTKRPRTALNWGFGSFLAVAAIQWELCRSARAKELRTMKVIQEKYAHRHVSKLQKRDPASTESASASDR